ncbi:MAG TPA: MmgE/PrpD family protein [Dongiaceae bacterium]|nr:MmgE/PrpD family protein [Dongiaceae bacterium]
MATDSMQHLIALARMPQAALPPSARQIARFSLFDWMVVGRAGRDQPVARIIRDHVASEGGGGAASLIGGGMASPRGAALVNGTVSHALDYDDTHFGHVGHPSVAIMPAALAVAEEVGASAEDVVDALLVGAEASIRLGMVLGREHYERGFHQTATAGAFGATVAAGRLYGLGEDAMRHALSLVATRASGLKSQFGTMGKPFNAGIAASNGVEAAGLAKRGFTSCDDGIGGAQGFIATHADAPDLDAPWADAPPGRFLFGDVKYKFHACCHGTHAMIEALNKAQATDLLQMDSLLVRVNPRWLKVCDIKRPRTGLEVKFSYAWLAAMVCSGMETAADVTYRDELASDPVLAEMASWVTVEGDPSVSDTAAEVELVTAHGRTVRISHDLAARLAPEAVEFGLRAKASALLGAEEAGRLWRVASGSAARSAREIGTALQGS